jgi:hypothetical protein
MHGEIYNKLLKEQKLVITQNLCLNFNKGLQQFKNTKKKQKFEA